jgi:hypothetical protein
MHVAVFGLQQPTGSFDMSFFLKEEVGTEGVLVPSRTNLWHT